MTYKDFEEASSAEHEAELALQRAELKQQQAKHAIEKAKQRYIAACQATATATAEVQRCYHKSLSVIHELYSNKQAEAAAEAAAKEKKQ